MTKEDEILKRLQGLSDIMHSNNADIMEKFNNGEKRFDKQDIAIADIQDQIKGNEGKDIQGLRPQIKEMKKVLIIPIFIQKLPAWGKWALIAVCVNGLADINSMGLIAFCKYLLHLTKP